MRGRELEALEIYGSGPQASRRGRKDQPIPGFELATLMAAPHADVGICDEDQKGKHVTKAKAASRPMLRGLVRGEFDEARYLACMRLVHEDLEPDDRVDAWSQLLKVAARKLDDPEGQRLVSALTDRPVDAKLDKKQVKKARKKIKRAAGQEVATRLAAVLDASEGRWQGKPVTAARLRQLDEAALDLLRRRLPDPDLRAKAVEALVSARIDASPFAIVRERRDEVIAKVVEDGHWPVPKGRSAASASFANEGPSARLLRIVARPRGAAATVLVSDLAGNPSDRAVIPLDGLSVQFEGLEQPIGACATAGELDPTPCVPTARLSLEHPLLSVSPRGELAVDQVLGIDEVVELGRGGRDVRVPLKVGATFVKGFALPLRFDPVKPIAFAGDNGRKGPNLTLDVYAISHDRLLVGVQHASGRANKDAGGRWVAVVEQSDGGFMVTSTGGAGLDGIPGRDGAAGRDGSPGSPGTCETDGGDGTDGTDGTPGGDGKPGGEGGDIAVTVHCSDDCRELEAWVRQHVKSLGGPGGDGGMGGKGGKGGRGGQGGEGGKGAGGKACEVSKPDGTVQSRSTSSGSRGRPGRDGNPGPRGNRGPDGQPGQVTVRLER